MGFMVEIFEMAKNEAKIRENARSQKSRAIILASQKSLSLWYWLIEQSALHRLQS